MFVHGYLLDGFGHNYYFFKLSRDRSQWKTTRRIVQRLVVLVIETGTITGDCAGALHGNMAFL